MEQIHKKGFKHYFLSMISMLIIMSALFFFGRVIYHYYYDFTVPITYIDVAIVIVLLLFAILLNVLIYVNRSLVLQTIMIEVLIKKETFEHNVEVSSATLDHVKTEIEQISLTGEQVNEELSTLNGKINKVRAYLNEID